MHATAVLDTLVTWADAQPLVRALILTSSRARADATVDDLSDYDVILAVTDEFGRDNWVSAYGRPLTRWSDEGEVLGVATSFRGVVYEDGVKVDYTLWPEMLLERVAEADALPAMLDVGYRVLLDKDERTARWRPPSFRAHIPAKPTEGEYRVAIDEFWWDTTYVAKALRRGELVFAKFALDYDAKFVALRRLLEWRIEVDHDWSLKPGAYGRGLERLLPADIWAELARTYVGVELDENWDALFGTVALFRRVARDVGDALGYAYQQEQDDQMAAYLEHVRAQRSES